MSDLSDTKEIDKGGRPYSINLDTKTLQLFEGFGQIQATDPEIAMVMSVSLLTLRETYKRLPELKDAYLLGSGTGKMSLRRRQFKLAEKNPAMAIHLGKNWLGQSDRAVVEHTGAGGGAIMMADLSNVGTEQLEGFLAVLDAAGINPGPGDGDEDGGSGGTDAA